jgi:hypothetical protein
MGQFKDEDAAEFGFLRGRESYKYVSGAINGAKLGGG